MPGRLDRLKSKLFKSHARTAKDTLTTILSVAELALDGCPVWGPKAAVSATLILLKGIDQTEQNVETLDNLRNYVQDLVRIVLTPISSVESTGVPDGLMTDINRLNNDLVHLVTDWDARSSGGSISNFFNRDKDSSDLVSLGQKLKDAVAAFQTSGTVRIQLAIETQRQELAERDARIQLAQEREAAEARARDEEARKRDAELKLAQQQATETSREEAVSRELSRLLGTLPRAEFASYDSGRSDTRKSCFEGTRTAVLKEIEEWFTNTDPDAPRLFWLNGLAGIGKSTIAQSVADRARARGVLGASFFFSRQDAKLSSPGLVFPEIAFQLAQFHPLLKTHIARALENDPSIGTKARIQQFNKLIIEPMAGVESPSGAVIVLDALDECEQQGATEILHLLMSMTRHSFPLFVFVTSRPEHHIRGVLNPPGPYTKVVLHDIEESVVQGDIEQYVRSRLAEIPESLQLELESNWVEEKSLHDLLSKCGKLFIYAATVLRFIANDVAMDPKAQLAILLQARPANGFEPHSELDTLYLQVLQYAMRNTKSTDMFQRFQKVVGTVVLLRDPLSVAALARFAGLDPNDITRALAHLHSIILVPPSPNGVPRVYHPSFPDFMTDPSRCTDPKFLIVPQDHHHRLALCCFAQMTSLERNMLEVDDPSLLNTEISGFDDKVNGRFPPELQYACQHWASHLVQVGSDTEGILAALEGFLSHWLLKWLEAMSLLGSMPVALESIKNAKDWAIKQENCDESSVFLSDTYRFILEHFDVIKARALHTYHSALPFTPRSNQVYKTYHKETWDTVHVLQGLTLEWSPHMTLGGHSGQVTSVAFSSDGSKLASGSYDYTVRMWDPTSGAHIATLEVPWIVPFTYGTQPLVHTLPLLHTPDPLLPLNFLMMGQRSQLIHQDTLISPLPHGVSQVWPLTLTSEVKMQHTKPELEADTMCPPFSSFHMR